MILHVLPGDACFGTFSQTVIEGERAVFRECLIDGDLAANDLDDFWAVRERYLSAAYPESSVSYRDHVVKEIEKLTLPGNDDEILLWFEYELFCSVNYWFCLSLLKETKAELYRVFPAVRDEDDKWQGFGGLSPDELAECMLHRVKLSRDDAALGGELWHAFQTGDRESLAKLSTAGSSAFPFLEEICLAAYELKTRPEGIIREIMKQGHMDFAEIFHAFTGRAGIYGFGDAQVRNILGRMTE